MEKIFSEDERVRRAEEIYFRRNNKNRNLIQNREKKTYFGSKILLNLLVLFNISVIIFCFQNKDYIFSESFLIKCNEYNINISEKVNSVLKKYLVEDGENNKINNNIVRNTINKENVIENNIIKEETLESSIDRAISLKPDVVLYEEGLDQRVINSSIKHVQNTNVLIIGGTSLAVYPAAGLIDYFKGDKLIVINMAPTPRDNYADLVIQEPIGAVFSALNL